jgi:Tol biopolymer transport system component
VGAAFLVLLSWIGIWRFSRKPPDLPPPTLEAVPLVAMPGQEFAPAFSPDGNQVAFAHAGEPNTAGIYTTLIDGEKPLRLTDNPHDSHPTWSPDGQQIAFARFSTKEAYDIYVVSSLGGTAHKLHTTPDVPARSRRRHLINHAHCTVQTFSSRSLSPYCLLNRIWINNVSL